MSAFPSPLPTADLSPALQDLLDRHARWWGRNGSLTIEERGEPLGDLWLPLADGRDATHDMHLLPESLDLNRLAGEPRSPGPVETTGDGLAAASPYARVPWVEAILGCDIWATIQSGSMRAHGGIRTWDDWHAAPHWHQGWFQLLQDLTERLVANSGGRYAVTHTLMRGPSDLAEALLGPELFCLSIYDHPQDLRDFMEQMVEVFLRVWRAQFERIPQLAGGYVNPFGIWAPGTVLRVQCDASSFLSPRQYADWVLPYDAAIANAADFSVIHLHSGALHTVDALLGVPKPQAIQITLDPEPAGPPIVDLIPVFGRILESKCILIDGPLTDDEMNLVQRCLPEDGRYIRRRLSAW